MMRSCQYFKFLLFIALFPWPIFGHAQDFQFSQYFASPSYLNPAMTAPEPFFQARLQQRVQWLGGGTSYMTSLASASAYIDTANSAIGGYVLYDNQGLNRLSVSQATLNYTYILPLSKGLFFRPGVSISGAYRGIDPSGLRSAPQFDEDGFNGQPNGLRPNRGFHADLGIGFLLYSPRFWVSTSFQHVTSPNVSLQEGGTYNLETLTSAHAGYRIPIVRGGDGVLMPAVNYSRQGNIQQLDGGGFFKMNDMLLGAWYRGLPLVEDAAQQPLNQAVVLLAGVNISSKFSVSYSYDIPIGSSSDLNAGGAHEISIRFRNLKQEAKSMPVPLPTL